VVIIWKIYQNFIHNVGISVSQHIFLQQYFLFSVTQQPKSGLIIEVSRSHTRVHT